MEEENLVDRLSLYIKGFSNSKSKHRVKNFPMKVGCEYIPIQALSRLGYNNKVLLTKLNYAHDRLLNTRYLGIRRTKLESIVSYHRPSLAAMLKRYTTSSPYFAWKEMPSILTVDPFNMTLNHNGGYTVLSLLVIPKTKLRKFLKSFLSNSPSCIKFITLLADKKLLEDEYDPWKDTNNVDAWRYTVTEILNYPINLNIPITFIDNLHDTMLTGTLVEYLSEPIDKVIYKATLARLNNYINILKDM